MFALQQERWKSVGPLDEPWQASTSARAAASPKCACPASAIAVFFVACGAAHVFLLKWTFIQLYFYYSGILSFFYHIVTLGALVVAYNFYLFTLKKPVAHLPTIVSGLCLGLATVLSAHAAQLNSIGLSQMFESYMLPVSGMALSLFRSDLSPQYLLALAPVCVGVSMVTSTDFGLDPKACLFGLLGLLSTVAYQMTSAYVMSTEAMQPLQLLSLQAPVAAAASLVLALFTDDLVHLATQSFLVDELVLMVAFALVFSALQIAHLHLLDRFGILIANVLLAVRICFVFFLGMLLLHSAFPARSWIGLLLVASGAMWLHQTSPRASAGALP